MLIKLLLKINLWSVKYIWIFVLDDWSLVSFAKHPIIINNIFLTNLKQRIFCINWVFSEVHNSIFGKLGVDHIWSSQFHDVVDRFYIIFWVVHLFLNYPDVNHEVIDERVDFGVVVAVIAVWSFASLNDEFTSIWNLWRCITFEDYAFIRVLVLIWTHHTIMLPIIKKFFVLLKLITSKIF